MSDQASNTLQSATSEGKGKGKAIDTQQPDYSMDEASEESEFDEEVEPEPEEEDEDNMEEIDLDNIVEGGQRTRGKTIDFAEAARKAQELGDDDEEEEDDDYVDPEAEADAMEE
ncbi:hypothetical protein EJ06DRAFT_524213 [Trichodelitschia bisporula]|uniref:Histone chaperone domain-containing protein n=1 Tax=Trichodelitschia bisporula TaxID=703511 RepID=A0A6G1HMZ0_9PEZI|nr:hypothetical protein EJ06DRAFT_524213 [Trichodelitschia bisporula]